MATANYKFLVLFPIPEPHCSVLCRFMDEVAEHTKLPPPYIKIPPHITFHRPIAGIEQGALEDIVTSSSLQIKQTRITVSSLFPFGKQYMVLPVHATLGLVSLWVGLNNFLSRLPEYVHSEFDVDNTLHITIAGKTSAVFDDVWPAVNKLSVPNLTIPVKKIELHRKLIDRDDKLWERVASFSIPQ